MQFKQTLLLLFTDLAYVNTLLLVYPLVPHHLWYSTLYLTLWGWEVELGMVFARHMGLDSICYVLSFIDCFYFGLMSSERKHPFYYIGLGLFLESSPMSGSVI